MTIADLIYLHPFITLIVSLVLLIIFISITIKFTDEYKEKQETYKAIIDLTLKVMRNAIPAEEWTERVNHLLLMNCSNADYKVLLTFKYSAQKNPNVELFFNFINHFRKQLNLGDIKKDDYVLGLFSKE